ncbi:hypothetical protein VTN02DRAFT_6457 [Thermoascus thermophilus]
MNQQAIPEMIEWCQKIGYQPHELNRLNPIHIAGTKGKGSTSAFISSILAQYLPANTSQQPSKINKVGLYTSPHLRFARERIKINNVPLSEEQFTRYFFETWDRLEESARAVGMDPKDPHAKPVYFRYLTLMAFHAYMSEGVDAAVIECGIGGEYDSTNIIVQPTVTGITSLGIDHVAVLGSTIEEIAWHKGGIMKPNAKAFTAPQPESALEVLRKRAEEKGTELQVADGHPELKKGGLKLGLAGDFQYTNAALAVAVAGEFLRKRGIEGIPEDSLNEPLPEKFRKGLAETQLGGRCETRHERNISWYIDGGHTLESIRVAAEWFASQIIVNSSSTEAAGKKPRVLIFNQQTRDSVALARALHQTLSDALGSVKPFTHAVFCTNVTYKDAGYRPDLVSINTNASDVEKLKVQKTLAETWKTIDPSATVEVLGTIEEAVEFVRDLAEKESGVVSGDESAVMALVTGSLHLVGGFLDVIETKPATS